MLIVLAVFLLVGIIAVAFTAYCAHVIDDPLGSTRRGGPHVSYPAPPALLYARLPLFLWATRRDIPFAALMGCR